MASSMLQELLLLAAAESQRNMNPYLDLLEPLKCKSIQEFYSRLEYTAKEDMGLEKLPFPLSALLDPPGNRVCPEINAFIWECLDCAMGDTSNAEVIKLIKHLKNNPPKVTYENPKIPDGEITKEERNLINHIFAFGIDLPGSKHNLVGYLQHFSSFFIDIFFGNYTEFIDHVNSLSSKELEMELRKREGYCQFSPIFASIIGLKMINIENNSNYKSKEKQELRSMYSGCNENKHINILKKLLELGADPNHHDINGFTPLHYALFYADVHFVSILLKYGANPNSESRDSRRPLSILTSPRDDRDMKLIEKMLLHYAKITSKEDIIRIRNSVESYGSKCLAVKVREALTRNQNECEKCVQPAVKKCSASGLVFYCSPSCQKMDWKFHKVTCQKTQKDEFLLV